MMLRGGGERASHLIVYVVLVDVVLVENQLQELSYCIHVDGLQFPGFAARLLVVTERDVAGRESTRRNHLTENVCATELASAPTELVGFSQSQVYNGKTSGEAQKSYSNQFS